MRAPKPPLLLMLLVTGAFAAQGCTKKAGGTEKGHESHAEGEEDHEGHAEGEEGHEDHEGHAEGDEEEHEGHEEHGEEGHEDKPVVLTPEAASRFTIETQPAVKKRIPLTLQTTARVAYDERRLAHVSPRVRGRVHAVLRELGDSVKAGERLAVLDSMALGRAKAAYLAARAEESLAAKTLKRARRLLQHRIGTQQEVIEAQAAQEKALAMLRSAIENLRLLGLNRAQINAVRYADPKAPLLTLKSPIDGQIVEKHLTIGELVTPNDKVYTIADLSRVWIWIDIYEYNLGRVHLEDDVAVHTRAWPGRAFRGKIAFIRAEVDPHTRTARARIDIDNTDRALKPGMFARVTVSDPHDTDGKSELSLRLSVPASAVLRDGDEEIAFVQTAPRRYERRELKIGARTEDLVEIVEGVREGEQVVVRGGFLLKSEAARKTMGHGHSH